MMKSHSIINSNDMGKLQLYSDHISVEIYKLIRLFLVNIIEKRHKSATVNPSIVADGLGVSPNQRKNLNRTMMKKVSQLFRWNIFRARIGIYSLINSPRNYSVEMCLSYFCFMIFLNTPKSQNEISLIYSYFVCGKCVRP